MPLDGMRKQGIYEQTDAVKDVERELSFRGLNQICISTNDYRRI